MGLYRSLSGMLLVELNSGDTTSALRVLTEAGILIQDGDVLDELRLRFRVLRRDYPKAVRILTKRGDHLKILRRDGLYWQGRGLLKRPVLLAGALILLMMVLYIPTRVCFIRVEGNTLVPERKILAAAEDSGIRFWASRQEVRSERVKNALLEQLPELQWAGVNTYGCVAVITVKERTPTEETVEERGVCSIVASRDGVIISCTVTKGNGLCRVGQAVKAGEVLISGYTDCGICIRATQAEGEIFARTNRSLVAVVPAEYTKRVGESGRQQKVSLLLGKKRINLWKGSGISHSSCGRMYSEYYLTLPGGFRLPLGLAVEEFTQYHCASEELSPEQGQSILAAFARTYLTEQMAAGSIVSAQEQTIPSAGILRLEGSYVCTEMIGRIQREQIGEYHGENN